MRAPAVTAAVLTGHRALQEAESEFVGAAWIDTGLVFTTALGGWVDLNNRVFAALGVAQST